MKSVPFFLLAIFLGLFCCVKAENKTWPEANANLTPIQQWRSAYYCLKNTTEACSKYVLNMSGWLNVTEDYKETFCQVGGCAEHILWLLDCVYHVKRDFWFENKATVKNLNDTVNNGCNSPQGFTGISIYSGGYRVHTSTLLLALVSLALFSV